MGGAKNALMRWRSQQRQQVVGRRRRGDVAARAEVHAGPQKDVELRAVVQRQRMQHGVALGHLAVDDAAHVLVDHRAVRQHRALGRRLGAAGVDDLQQVVAADVDLGRRGRCVDQHIESQRDAGRRGRRLFRWQPQQPLDARVARRGVLAERRQAAVDRQQPRAGVAQDVGGLVGVEHEVHRHQHGPQSCEGKSQGCKAMRVARQHRDPIAPGHTLRVQPSGQARGDGVELAPGPRGVAAADGWLVGQARSGAAQQIGKGLAADGGRGCMAISRSICKAL